MTGVVFALALLLTPAGPLQCVTWWGDGFWELLSFAMQMTVGFRIEGPQRTLFIPDIDRSSS